MEMEMMIITLCVNQKGAIDLGMVGEGEEVVEVGEEEEDLVIGMVVGIEEEGMVEVEMVEGVEAEVMVEVVVVKVMIVVAVGDLRAMVIRVETIMVIGITVIVMEIKVIIIKAITIGTKTIIPIDRINFIIIISSLDLFL